MHLAFFIYHKKIKKKVWGFFSPDLFTADRAI